MAKRRRRRLQLSPDELELLASRTLMPPGGLRQRIIAAQQSGWDPPWPSAATSQEVYARLRSGPAWSAQRIETFEFFRDHQDNRSWWCAPSQKDIERFFEEGSGRGHARRTEELVRAGRLWVVGKKFDTQWIWNERHRGKREEVKGEALLDRAQLRAEASLSLGGVKLDAAEEPKPANRFVLCYRIAWSVEPHLLHGFPVSNRLVTNKAAREMIRVSASLVRRSLNRGTYGDRRDLLASRLQAIETFAGTREWWDATGLLLPPALNEEVRERASRLRRLQRIRDRETRQQVCRDLPTE